MDEGVPFAVEGRGTSDTGYKVSAGKAEGGVLVSRIYKDAAGMMYKVKPHAYKHYQTKKVGVNYKVFRRKPETMWWTPFSRKWRDTQEEAEKYLEELAGQKGWDLKT